MRKGIVDGFLAGLAGIFLMAFVWVVWDAFFMRLMELSTVGRCISLATVTCVGGWLGWKFLR